MLYLYCGGRVISPGRIFGPRAFFNDGALTTQRFMVSFCPVMFILRLWETLGGHERSRFLISSLGSVKFLLFFNMNMNYWADSSCLCRFCFCQLRMIFTRVSLCVRDGTFVFECNLPKCQQWNLWPRWWWEGFFRLQVTSTSLFNYLFILLPVKWFMLLWQHHRVDTVSAQDGRTLFLGVCAPVHSTCDGKYIYDPILTWSGL